MNKTIITDAAVAGQSVIKTHRPLDQIIKDRAEVDRQLAALKMKRNTLDKEIEDLAAAVHEAIGG